MILKIAETVKANSKRGQQLCRLLPSQKIYKFINPMSQILSEIASVDSDGYVKHLVTMQHFESLDEIVLWVRTETESFNEVLLECKRVLAAAWLDEGLDYRGYHFFESVEVVDGSASTNRNRDRNGVKSLPQLNQRTVA